MSANLYIKLTKEESLVLLAFLYRINQGNYPSLFIHQSEQRVVWDIEAILEKNLEGPLQQDYETLLFNAREKLKDKE